jgi:hypothetical protein
MITKENLEIYKQTENELSRICREWVKANLDTSCHYYCGFKVCDEYIIISYSYNNGLNNIDYEPGYGSKCISIDDIIKFAKTL